MRRTPFTPGLLALAALAAQPADADEIEIGNALEGAELYATYCAACHGTEARGDGRMAAILNVLPADLTQLSARNGGVFPVSKVVFQIDGRDPLLAHGGEMPIFGEFFTGQDTALPSETGQPIMTSGPIADLVAWLREVQE